MIEQLFQANVTQALWIIIHAYKLSMKMERKRSRPTIINFIQGMDIRMVSQARVSTHTACKRQYASVTRTLKNDKIRKFFVHNRTNVTYCGQYEKKITYAWRS